MKRTSFVAVVAAILLAFFGGVSPSAQEKVIALRATWLIDATGRPPIADGVVLVKGNRIEAVGARGSVTIPAGAEVVDAEVVDQ